MNSLVSAEIIAARILEIRGNKVMVDRDLAKLYGVSVKRLNEQVRRNIERFPDDFMYQLTWQEVINLKSQFAISSSRSQFAILKQRHRVPRFSGIKT